MRAQLLSRVRLLATLWTVAHQAPLSMVFPGKNTGVGCHSLLQGLFPTQETNSYLLCLLHWQAYSLLLSHLGNPPAQIFGVNTVGMVRALTFQLLDTTLRRDLCECDFVERSLGPCPQPMPPGHSVGRTFQIRGSQVLLW